MLYFCAKVPKKRELKQIFFAFLTLFVPILRPNLHIYTVSLIVGGISRPFIFRLYRDFVGTMPKKLSNNDVILSNNDVILSNNDVILSNNDVILTLPRTSVSHERNIRLLYP